MSYPRAIQALVIEDEPGPKSYYEAVFDRLAKAGQDIDPPHFAFCHEEGLQALATPTIYHLVVLDLRLPLKPMEPAPDSISFGQNLLEACASRNAFPIPAILVISGHLDKADQTDLEARVNRGFAYGRVLTKGPKLGEEIERAIRRIHCYCDIGVHIRDGGTVEYPALAPREEDLLRRAAMEQEICGGIDLQWWADEYAPPAAADDPHAGWTKTFMGTWILSRGRGRSRPLFFKLAPAEGADSVAAEAKLLEAKLPHIKVTGAWSSGDRSLLITEKVGDGDGPPIPLVDFLGRATDAERSAIPGIVSAVSAQIAKLGERRPDQILPGKLFWPHHDVTRLRTQWARWAKAGVVPPTTTALDPISLFERLRGSAQIIAVKWQSALHGDLNVTNVALDVGPDIRGYIFDASGTSAGVDIRDLAMLEITALLHQPVTDEDNLLRVCRQFYVLTEPGAATGAAPLVSRRASNTVALVEAIRLLPAVASQPEVYALALLDQALLQLGGLAFAVSRNKIRRPDDAAAVCDIASQHVQAVAGRLI